MTRYARLKDHLSRQRQARWTATFEEIERVLGFALPASARVHPAWWANQTGGGHSQARAWQEAGWRTLGLDLKAGRVDFERIARPASPDILVDPSGTLFEQAHARTGIADRDALIRAGLQALIERDAARRLIRLGGTMPDFVAPPRRRGEEE